MARVRHQWLPSMYGGGVVGVFTIIASLSFGTLIFAGDLSFGVSQGISMALISAVLVGGIVALRSSYPATIAIPQDRTAPILALMAAHIAANLPASTSPEVKAVTILTAIALTSVITGCVLYALGRLQLGILIRFIPYPVVGGFLAGSGWLLVLGAMRVMTDQFGSPWQMRRIFDFTLVSKWLPGVVLGVLLFVVLRRFKKPVLVPVFLVGALVVFYGVVITSGSSISETRASGWLPGIPQGGGIGLEVWKLSPFAEIHWSVFAGVSGLAGTVTLTAHISILLNASALELAAHHEIDLNRELRAAGVANVARAAGRSWEKWGCSSACHVRRR